MASGWGTFFRLTVRIKYYTFFLKVRPSLLPNLPLVLLVFQLATSIPFSSPSAGASRCTLAICNFGHVGPSWESFQNIGLSVPQVCEPLQGSWNRFSHRWDGHCPSLRRKGLFLPIATFENCFIIAPECLARTGVEIPRKYCLQV